MIRIKDARFNRFVFSFIAVVALAAIVVGFSDTAAAHSVLRFGGNVIVEAEERIVGDVVAVGGTIEITGEVDGDIVAIGGAISVDGTVTGDVVAIGGSTSLGETARVNGMVTAIGGTVNRNPEAIVRGEVSIISISETIQFGFRDLDFVSWRWFGFPFGILYVAGLFAMALLVLSIIPDNVHAIGQHMQTNAGRSIVIGLLSLLLLVPLTVVLVLTIVGPPLLWLGYFVAKMVGYVALVSVVGRKVTERFATDVTPIWELVAGVLIVAVLRYVPIFGALFTFIATVWTVGAVLDTKFGTNRPWLPPRQA